MGKVTNLNEHEPRFRHKPAKSRPNATSEFLANGIGLVEVDRKRITVRKLDDHLDNRGYSASSRSGIIIIQIQGSQRHSLSYRKGAITSAACSSHAGLWQWVRLVGKYQGQEKLARRAYCLASCGF
jgi:hypothetical protein